MLVYPDMYEINIFGQPEGVNQSVPGRDLLESMTAVIDTPSSWVGCDRLDKETAQALAKEIVFQFWSGQTPGNKVPEGISASNPSQFRHIWSGVARRINKMVSALEKIG